MCNLFKIGNFRFVIEFLNKYEKDWWSVIYVGSFLKMYFCILLEYVNYYIVNKFYFYV